MEDGRWSTPHVGSVGRGQVERVASFSGIFDGRWYFQVVKLESRLNITFTPHQATLAFLPGEGRGRVTEARNQLSRATDSSSCAPKPYIL